MPRKDKMNDLIYRHLLSKNFTNTWDSYTNNEYINKILSKSSKHNSGKNGFPDHIYVNDEIKMLILVEDKNQISFHQSQDGISDPINYAVDGVIHYLKQFKRSNLENFKIYNYFENWKIIGIAISGNIEDEYNHRISTFYLLDDNIKQKKELVDILDEEDYENLFDNLNEEQIISNIAVSSKKINNLLRTIDSQDRPVLLSILMISLLKVKNSVNSFIKEYQGNSPIEICNKLPYRLDEVLNSENIPKIKRDIIKKQLDSILENLDLKTQDILKNILNELDDNVIPLFMKKSNYDIIGKFYEEFLRYAGVANVKKGIVLTPHHITTLFTELIPLKYTDVIFDPACGTGSFLIAGMNELIDIISKSEISGKEELIRNFKSSQLVGFEKHHTMYTLALSNMMFRGDGKSRIYNEDFFSKEADEILQNLKKEGIIPTVGFINPPYGGKDNKDNPTKKEIQFLTRMLDIVSRYGVIIAPMSTYFKDSDIRSKILKKHTLKCVINMPGDLFMPNAAINTAIAVFETNVPHGNKEVVFYELKEDGFELSKNKGRTDVYNKWGNIKKDLINKLNNSDRYNDNVNLVKTKIKNKDEWLFQAHCLTDFTKLTSQDFENSIKEHMVFKVLQDLNLLEDDLDVIKTFELVHDYYSNED